MCLLAQSNPFEDRTRINAEMRRMPAVDDGSLIPELGRTSTGLDPNETDPESPFRIQGLPNGSMSRQQDKPIAGLVSLTELQHQPSKKAVRLLLDAQRYSSAHETRKAIAKLEQAIQVDPSFREAHLNLGVQYARSARVQDAMTEFQRAVDIGPPDVKAYSNLAWCYARLGQFHDAEVFARRALALDPSNAPAQTIFRIASSR